MADQALIRVACIGECMIELAHKGPAELQLAYGGDTLNTAVYLSRLTRGLGAEIDYVTALGDDAYSEAMLAFWREEGLGVGLVPRLPGRLPGLYTIRTDQQGERSFTYWRGQAAARDLFLDGRDVLLAGRLSNHDLLYLSGITLSILDQPQRAALFALVDSVRQAGGRLAFDGNFRPAGWPTKEEARAVFEAILARTDIALPTLDDEQSLYGSADHLAVAKHLHDLGVSEVVVKLGARGCYVSVPGAAGFVGTSPVEAVVDSTAAGDSFNAGYLAARLFDQTPQIAAQKGHELAGRVVCHRGAIIPLAAMADLMPRQLATPHEPVVGHARRWMISRLNKNPAIGRQGWHDGNNQKSQRG